MTPHLLRYQDLAVDDYSCGLDALDLGHSRQRRASLDFCNVRVKAAINSIKRKVKTILPLNENS